MAEYDNTNRGALFVNDKKAKDTHPDRTGSINIDGVEYFLDGWIKDTAKGKILSLSAKRKDKQPSAPAQPKRSNTIAPAARYGSAGRERLEDIPDDMPF